MWYRFSEFNEFEPRLKSLKTGLIEHRLKSWNCIEYDFKWNNLYLIRALNLSQGVNLNRGSNSLDSASVSFRFREMLFLVLCRLDRHQNSKFPMNCVFGTNSNILIPISLQPNGIKLWYFKLRLFSLTEFIVWNI